LGSLQIHPGVQTIVRASELVCGRTPLIGGFVAVADIAWLAEAGGTPCVLFGPAGGDGSHGANEHIEISELIEGTKMLAIAIASWSGVSAA